MLISRFASRYFALVLPLLLAGMAMHAQRSVSLLRAPADPTRLVNLRSELAPAAETFVFERNLIFFQATVDGDPGTFILDTGAPTLVMNNRGESENRNSYTGYGSGGSVDLTDHRVEAFEMSGMSLRNYWAIGLDLRAMESRVGHRIDGMVGYDLLNDGELRIDYAARSFRLLPSERRPNHENLAPRAVLKFSLVDHLPIIRLRINGKRYDFAIDTGAGSNLVDEAAARSMGLLASGDAMNIQGLDGRPVEAATYLLPAPEEFSGKDEAVQLVAMDLSHLQDNGRRLAGILGSAFLSRYTVGIDYRRRKVYLW